MDQSIKQTLSTICRAVSVIAIGLTIVGTSCSHNKSDSGSFVEIEGVNVSLSGDVADAVIIYSNIDNLYMRHGKSSPLLSCFDWDGNALTKYKLSPGFSSFTVSPSHILWANSEDDDYEGIIMRYELSKK